MLSICVGRRRISHTEMRSSVKHLPLIVFLALAGIATVLIETRQELRSEVRLVLEIGTVIILAVTILRGYRGPELFYKPLNPRVKVATVVVFLVAVTVLAVAVYLRPVS